MVHLAKRRSHVGLPALFAILCAFTASLAFAGVAKAEYHSYFQGYTCSGCHVVDTEAWEHGGYHTWEYGLAERYEKPKQPRICMLMFNGTGYEEGSICEPEVSQVYRVFLNKVNALAEVAGETYNGSDLTMEGAVES